MSEAPSAYAMPASGRQRLNGLVDQIQARPGRLIGAGEFDELLDRVDSHRPVPPAGLSLDDLIGILTLSCVTESVADIGAEALDRAARRHEADWLGRWGHDVWLPDEQTHAAPYHAMLRSLGVSDAELDRRIADARGRAAEFRPGDTPIHLTTYGIVQEFITDYWHGRVAQMLRGFSPEAAYMARRIKTRETLHAVWCRDMTALQLEANPALLPLAAEALAAFRMPGDSFVPDLHQHMPAWGIALEMDPEALLRGAVRLLHGSIPDVAAVGELVTEVAAKQGQRIGPLTARQVQGAMTRFGDWGFGLIGEALLERAGLSYTFASASPSGRVRSTVRTWLAGQLELDVHAAPAEDGS